MAKCPPKYAPAAYFRLYIKAHPSLRHDRKTKGKKASLFYPLAITLLSLLIITTDNVRLTTAFGSDHPVVSRNGRKSNLI